MSLTREARPPPLPLMYLPGASGRAAVWHPIAAKLAPRRPPLLVDYPGLSDLPLEPALDSLDALTRWVLARAPSRFDVVSLSMGAAVALRLALSHPDRLGKLVLVTPAAGVDPRPFGAVDWRPAFVARRPDAPRWFIDDRADLTFRLGSIHVPVQLVFGERDPIAPPALGQHLLASLPSAWLEVIPGATHDLEHEQPDWLASVIERHLRR